MNPAHLRREDVDPAAVEKERDVAGRGTDLEAEKIKTEAERVLAQPDQQIQDPNNLEKMTSSHGRARGDLKKAEGMLKNKAKVIEGRMGDFFGERCLLEQIARQPGQVRHEDNRRVGQGGRHDDQGFRPLGTAQGVSRCRQPQAMRSRPAVPAGSC